jgi:hypothetical protein
VDNLSALTGLAGEDLNWLANQARDLSTLNYQRLIQHFKTNTINFLPEIEPKLRK